MREACRKERPELWRDKSRVIHCDNAPAYTTLLIQQFLAKHKTVVISQQPFSINTATGDFLIPKRYPKMSCICLPENGNWLGICVEYQKRPTLNGMGLKIK